LSTQQQEQLENQRQEIEILKEELRKLKGRNPVTVLSHRQDLLKKPSTKPKDQAKKADQSMTIQVRLVTDLVNQTEWKSLAWSNVQLVGKGCNKF